MKKGVNKEAILKIVITIIFIIFLGTILTIVVGKWGFSGNSAYIITKGGCSSALNTTKDSNLPTYTGACQNPGYHINNNTVTINIGAMNCASSIAISKIKVDKNMNVYIKAKEKKSAEQAKCICSPTINIKFTNKVNSVTLVTEDGTELGECE